MKNLIILLLMSALMATGYFYLKSNWKMQLEGLEGKQATLERGDLTLPVNANGEIRPSRRIEIKAEASGAVLEVIKHPGDRVKVGDLIIRLQPDDEQRSVERAERELEVAKARLEESKITLQQSRTSDLNIALQRVKQLEQSVKMVAYRKRKTESLPEHQRNDDEMLQASTNFWSQTAQLEEAKATYEKAKLTIKRSEQLVKQSEASLESAKTNLGDAKKRLSKTDITSPIDGIIADVLVQFGEVIQGGKTTLTGGTLLAVVVDMNKLVLRAEVDEADIGRVLKIAPEWAKPGHADNSVIPQTISELMNAAGQHRPEITVESFRDQDFEGVIERIYPEPRNLNNVVTYLVDVVITSDNRDVLLPGMRADVRFTAEHVESVVLCPNEAIREGPASKLGVYIPKASDDPNVRLTEFKLVKLGLSDGNMTEVRLGLSEGDTVYTKLPVNLKGDKAKVEVR